MQTSPTVLLLVHDANERELLTRRLTEVAAIPIAVHADTAIDALDAYRPVAAVLDEAHASTAPDAFLEATCARHVRLLTWSAPQLADGLDVETLRRAVEPPAYWTPPMSVGRVD
jgi:hypothetical protein